MRLMQFRAKDGSRGVAVVVIPGEIFLEPAPSPARPAVISPSASVIRPSDDALGVAAEDQGAIMAE